MIVTPAGHRLADKQYVRPKDLSDEMLFATSALERTILLQRVLRPAGIRAGNIKEIPIVEAVLELVKADFGIAILGRRSIQPYLSRAEFRVIPATARGLFRNWYAAIRPAKEPQIRSFVQALCVELAN
jgi:LysR family transcriptional regulator for metE and metH